MHVGLSFEEDVVVERRKAQQRFAFEQVVHVSIAYFVPHLEALEKCLGIIPDDGHLAGTFKLEPNQIRRCLEHDILDFKLLWSINLTFAFAAKSLAFSTRFKKLDRILRESVHDSWVLRLIAKIRNLVVCDAALVEWRQSIRSQFEEIDGATGS